jgi:cell cycle checkpoint protein
LVAVLDFINDEAIDDAWMALSYLSDSDYLLGASSIRHLRRPQALLDLDEVDSAHVVESIAGSVMTRGVLFANSHPAPPRYLFNCQYLCKKSFD